MAKKKIKPVKKKSNAKPIQKKSASIKTVKTKTGKRTPAKDRSRKNNSKKATAKRNKPIQKVSKVSKVNIQGKQKRKNVKLFKSSKRKTFSKKVNSKSTRGAEIVYSKGYAKNTINFDFKGNESIEEKYIAFNTSDIVRDKIKYMVNRKGKPPRGVIIKLVGERKDDSEMTVDAIDVTVSDFDFVVNVDSVIGLCNEAFENLLTGWEKIAKMNDLFNESDSSKPFNPDTIRQLSIVFIP